MAAKRQFFQHIHYFRAIAIVFVVMSHALLAALLGSDINDPFFGFAYLLFANATIFFALISGFLSQHNSYGSAYSYSAMIKKKVLYLFVPLVVVALPAMIATMYVSPGSPGYKVIAGAVGAVNWALYSPLWFIFFILLAFIISPQILKFARWKWSFTATLLAATLGFFFFPRQLSHWPGVIPYFLPVFALGAIMSQRYEQFQGYIQRYYIHFAILALAFMLLFILFQISAGEVNGSMIFGLNLSIGPGIKSVCGGYFKIFLALFFWGFLMKFDHREIKILDIFANYEVARFV